MQTMNSIIDANSANLGAINVGSSFECSVCLYYHYFITLNTVALRKINLCISFAKLDYDTCKTFMPEYDNKNIS